MDAEECLLEEHRELTRPLFRPPPAPSRQLDVVTDLDLARSISSAFGRGIARTSNRSNGAASFFSGIQAPYDSTRTSVVLVTK